MLPSKRCQAALRTTEVIMKLAFVICLPVSTPKNNCTLPPTLSSVTPHPHFLLFFLSLPHLPQHFLMHFFIGAFIYFYFYFFFRQHFSPLIANSLLPSSHTFLHDASSARLLFPASLFQPSSPSCSPSSLLPHSLGTLTPSDCITPPVKKLSTRILNIITSILHIYCAALGCLLPQGENNGDDGARGGYEGRRRSDSCASTGGFFCCAAAPRKTW